MKSKEKVTVDILMATYNGELYVRQQILSIISQTYTHWILYVHDDGSSDNTIKIVKELSSMDNRIVLIEDNIRFGNAGKNFNHLLSFSKNDLICFCDQDDIWFENKLEILVSKFPLSNNTPAALISSGYIYQNKTNQITGQLNYQISNLKELLFINGGVHGSRSMINRKMSEEIIKFECDLIIHDHIMSLIAVSFGQIKYIDDILFLYRQHSSNVTGNIESSLIKRCLKFISTRTKSEVISKNSYKAIKLFRSSFKNNLDYNDLILIDTYLRMPNFGRLKRICTIIRYGFSRNGSSIKLIALLLTQKYISE